MVKPVFIKAQAASLIASIIDFLSTVLLVEVMGWPKVVSGATGTTIGGITNFMLGRHWVFNAPNKRKMHHQAIKYLLVWMGNFVLNTGGLALMVNVFNANYIFSKVLVSLTVGFTYNYLLQKRFVFKH